MIEKYVRNIILSSIIFGIMVVLIPVNHIYADIEGDYEYEISNDVVNITNYIGEDKEIIIPNEINGKAVNWIRANAFKSKGLTKVNTGKSVTWIGNDAFSDNDIKEIYIGENLDSFSEHAFENNPLETIIVDSQNEWFEDIDYKGLYTKKISPYSLKLGTVHGEIADGVKSIGFNAFFGIPIEGNLVIPDSVESISTQAFYNSNVKTVKIGKGLETFGYFAFANNPLETVIVDNENHYFKDINHKGLYSKDGKNLIQGTVHGQIEEGTNSIVRGAFSDIGLTDIIIPSSIEEIGERSFSNSGLRKLTFPESVSHDGIVINSSAFSHYPKVGNLEQLEIPVSVRKINGSAFLGAVKSGTVTIKGAREGIGIGAFQGPMGFYGIEEVYIDTDFDDGVNSFPGAFIDNNIKKIVIDAVMDEYSPEGDFLRNPVEEIYIGKGIKRFSGELIDTDNQKVYGFSNLLETDFIQEYKDEITFTQVDSPPTINMIHDGKIVKKEIVMDAQSTGKLEIQFEHDVASIKNVNWKVDGESVSENQSLDLTPYTETLHEKTITLVVETEYGGIAEKEIKLKIKHKKQVKPQISINGSTVTISDNKLIISEEGSLLNIDLSKEPKNINEIKISIEQIKTLIDKKATIQIVKDNVMLNIPSINLQNNQPLTISIEQIEIFTSKIPNAKESHGMIFNFTLKQGDKEISRFKEAIELIFPVNEMDSETAKKLKVYYWNENSKEWELVGGEYKDGHIHAFTDHFSTFGLFHPEAMIKPKEQSQNHPIKKKEAESNMTSNEAQNKQQLPKTASNNYNLMLIGIVILLFGGIIYMWRRYSKAN